MPHPTIRFIYLPSAVLILIAMSCTGKAPQSGPYLGQTPPVDEPELFAPGIVSTGLSVRDMAMTPDGNELYFGVVAGNYKHATIAWCRRENGRWTTPEIAPFASDSRFFNLEPHITPDGQRFYFLSTRPPEGKEPLPGWGYQDIWVMDRTADGWSEPYNLGPPVNSEAPEFFPSVTSDGTMYFTRGGRESYLYRARMVDGQYAEPEKLGPEVNSTPAQYNAFIAPDESYLIFSTERPDGFGAADYYVCFRSAEDTWTEPINLGERINSPGRFDYSPYVSPDGRYFFFCSQRLRSAAEVYGEEVSYEEMLAELNAPENGSIDIYWVEAAFIEQLRPR
ncbi:MAG: PD40 domain-containing protein [Fidelibacterota bacterium]|nr:MAG: PD40 domain-containing protein [Candidatus Neomarinimicrobiota bacterium]